ncbi:saccharopine dehydrogenase [Nonomuraea phyllanthi]|uniref:Saccharopine dehydrogenase n=1 Tax=Nonomuraea phyllanthi TaxID=2219224 RepID=A0A5C4WR71_9ACTN|nr:saccharopine dehydrogenase [Nonomuraea phyllanthi]
MPSPQGVLVIGGYGAVGAVVCRTLATWFPGRVVPAGRDLERARRLAAEIGSDEAVGVDVTDAGDFGDVLARHRIGAVVLCVEPLDDRIARACLTRGIHLVDIGASHHLLAQVEALDSAAAATGAAAVLSVGVAPGLTNLLARRAHLAVGGADQVDLTVLLGAGERHGADAVRWTVSRLAAPSPGAARPRRAWLPGYGLRTAHPFPFSDQYTLRRTLGVRRVTTRLCLDSRALTAALFGLRRAGAFRAARRPDVERAVTAAFSMAHLGGDGWAVRADARKGDERASSVMTGKAQSRATALVAAHVTRGLLADPECLIPGVRHIDEVPALASLPEDLCAYDIDLHETRDLLIT